LRSRISDLPDFLSPSSNVIPIGSSQPKHSDIWQTLEEQPKQINASSYNDRLVYVGNYIVWLCDYLSDQDHRFSSEKRELITKIGTDFQAHVAPDPEEALAQARAAASMSRLDFAKLALREDWITAAEAKAWVPGNALPQIVTDIIAQHIEGADKQDIAEINALGQTVVNRNDLLLRLLMMSKKVTDAQMDAHFGVAE
jgi:hypothetical protein